MLLWRSGSGIREVSFRLRPTGTRRLDEPRWFGGPSPRRVSKALRRKKKQFSRADLFRSCDQNASLTGARGA